MLLPTANKTTETATAITNANTTTVSRTTTTTYTATTATVTTAATTSYSILLLILKIIMTVINKAKGNMSLSTKQEVSYKPGPDYRRKSFSKSGCVTHIRRNL